MIRTARASLRARGLGALPSAAPLPPGTSLRWGQVCVRAKFASRTSLRLGASLSLAQCFSTACLSLAFLQLAQCFSTACLSLAFTHEALAFANGGQERVSPGEGQLTKASMPRGSGCAGRQIDVGLPGCTRNNARLAQLSRGETRSPSLREVRFRRCTTSSRVSRCSRISPEQRPCSSGVQLSTAQIGWRTRTASPTGAPRQPHCSEAAVRLQ